MYISGIFSGGRVEVKNTTSNNLYTPMGTCVYGFHPSTFASTIQIFNIFYIIFFQNLKKNILRSNIYRWYLLGGNGGKVQ